MINGTDGSKSEVYFTHLLCLLPIRSGRYFGDTGGSIHTDYGSHITFERDGPDFKIRQCNIASF